jgi:glycosyltransferase involved in cell wall biosynthesis
MPIGIIAFSKDWDDDPTSNHHVLRELAKGRRVLWLNSVTQRRPSLAAAHDRRRILRKLRAFVAPPLNVENDLWVFTPLVLPFPHSRLARKLNTEILRLTFRFLRRRLGLEEFDLWTFLPSVSDYVGTLGESLSVYYCVDEYSLFSEMATAETLSAEASLLDKVDCVFAVNHALAEVKRRLNPETHAALHGVSHGLFSSALSPDTAVPADVAGLPSPVLGFYGTIEDWVDLELLAELAHRRPDWTIAMVGRVAVDVTALDGLPNVHLLGRRPHHELPAYCKGFDVGLIPYRLGARAPFVNPIKLREYLSAGLPVVSTPLDEVTVYQADCTVAADADGFVSAIERFLGTDSAEARGARSRAMESESWAARVREIDTTVERVRLARLSEEHQALTKGTV